MKCSVNCKYYQAYVSGNGVKVVCAIRGLEIKEIKKKMTDTYENCEKYCKSKGDI